MTLVEAFTIAGVITVYLSGQYGGNVLYCDDGRGLVYDDSRAFIALPVSAYQDGSAQCGDWIRVTIDEHALWVQALDAGPLEKYHIEQYGQIPIIGDLPEHVWPLDGAISAQGTLFNESAFNRSARDVRMGHLR